MNNLLKFIFSLFIVLTLAGMSSFKCEAQALNKGFENVEPAEAVQKIKWMSFENAVAQNEKQPKKIFIDIYTHWCGWCKKMDKSTFLEDSVANYINRNYYAVKLDAETKDTIHFRNKQFIYKEEYKANELALSLLSGKMGYPSYIFLDENFTMVTPPVQSYMNKEDLLPLLLFFGENIYKNKTWDDYKAGK